MYDRDEKAYTLRIQEYKYYLLTHWKPREPLRKVRKGTCQCDVHMRERTEIILAHLFRGLD